MALGIAITLKQEFKLLGYKYACNNLKQNLNNLKYWDKHGQKCYLPCFEVMLFSLTGHLVLTKYFLQVVQLYNHDDHTVQFNPLRLLFKRR